MRPQKNRGGTELKETVLWTNPSPTVSFGAQTVTLSQNIEDFQYIAVYNRVSTTNTSESYVMCTVDEFKNFILTGTHTNMALGIRLSGNRSFARAVYYSNATQIEFANAYEMTAPSGNNAYVIPTKIVGLK